MSKPYDASQRPKAQEAVKQPLNPFMLWCKSKRAALVAEQPGTKPSDISKQLGELWRNMSEEEKSPFVEEAKRVKAEHEKNHPDFKRQHRKTKKGPIMQSSHEKTPPTQGTSSHGAPSHHAPKPQTSQFSAGFVTTAQGLPNLAAYQFQHPGMRVQAAQGAQGAQGAHLMMGGGGGGGQQQQQQGMTQQYGGLQYAFMQPPQSQQQHQQQGTSSGSQGGAPNVPTTGANANPPSTTAGGLPFYF